MNSQEGKFERNRKKPMKSTEFKVLSNKLSIKSVILRESNCGEF